MTTDLFSDVSGRIPFGGLEAREYTRDQARQHHARALAELEAAGVVDAEALESLRAIIVGVIKA